MVRLAAYLASLERIADLTGNGEVTRILPGHGPVVPDAAAMVAFYSTHRQERLEQVRQALTDGAAGEADPVEGVLTRVYADVPREVWPAARMSIRAQAGLPGDPLSPRSRSARAALQALHVLDEDRAGLEP